MRPIADLVAEVSAGTLARAEALKLVDRRLVAQAASSIDIGETELAHGVPAGPGAASGHAVFSAEDASRFARVGLRPILVVHETSPEDIAGMQSSSGVVTIGGGLTGHAAIVSRGLGRPCLAGGSAFDLRGRVLMVRTSLALEWHEGHRFSFDGKTGVIVDGTARLATPSEELSEALSWADDIGGAAVLGSVASSIDAENARRFGARAIAVEAPDAFLFDATLPHGDDPGFEAAVEALLGAELMSITSAFGAPPVRVRSFGLERRPELDRALAAACRLACPDASLVDAGVGDDEPRAGSSHRAYPPEALLERRLVAALEALSHD